MRSVVRDARGGRAMAEYARNPIPVRPANEVGSRGRYEACLTEVSRLLTMLKAENIPDSEMRALTIRMARLQKELKELRSAVDDLSLLADQVVEAVLRHTS